MVNTILIDIHKNYIVMNNSCVYAVTSIFQITLWARERALGAAELQVNLQFDNLPCTIDVLFGYFHSNDSIYKKAVIRLLE